MSSSSARPLLGLILLGALTTAAAQTEGDPERGVRVFRACAACHSLEAGRHMTGPSLAGLWGRQAGAAPGFARYSKALEEADIVWNEETLDPWLADPAAFLPGNRMLYRGIEDEQARADLIAFLKTASAGEAAGSDRGAPSGGGMMGGGPIPDLKAVGPNQRVTGLAYCGDTYRVTTEAGRTFELWEFNLRFKTDSSAEGPAEGQPVLLRAGMMGDRVFIVFAGPGEISPFIRRQC